MTNTQNTNQSYEPAPQGLLTEIAPYALWSLFAALVVAVIVHFLKSSRDAHAEKRRNREAVEGTNRIRKMDFIALLRGAETELRQHVQRFPVTFPEIYAAQKILIEKGAVLAGLAFSGANRTKFDELTGATCRYSGNEASQVQNQKQILEDIRTLSSYVADT